MVWEISAPSPLSNKERMWPIAIGRASTIETTKQKLSEKAQGEQIPLPSFFPLLFVASAVYVQTHVGHTDLI